MGPRHQRRSGSDGAGALLFVLPGCPKHVERSGARVRGRQRPVRHRSEGDIHVPEQRDARVDSEPARQGDC